MLARNFLQFLGSLIFLWLISWKLTLFILALTPVISFVILFIIKAMKKHQKQYSNNLAYASSLATEVFGNIRVVRSFSNELMERKNYNTLLSKVFLVGRKKNILYGIMLFVMTIFANLLILSILYFGGQLVIDDELSIGDLTSFVLYTITLTIGFASLSGIMNQTISAIGIC